MGNVKICSENTGIQPFCIGLLSHCGAWGALNLPPVLPLSPPWGREWQMEALIMARTVPGSVNRM